jgi:rubrerythrin
MPGFGNPFEGLNLDRPLTKEELVRAVRFVIAAEYEAVQLYRQISLSANDERASKVLDSMTQEEVIHAGEFLKLLTELDPNEARLYQKGFQEATDTMKLSMSKKIAQKFLKVR